MSATTFLRSEHVLTMKYGSDSDSANMVTLLGTVQDWNLDFDANIVPTYTDGSHVAIGLGEGNRIVNFNLRRVITGGKMLLTLTGAASGSNWGDSVQTEQYVYINITNGAIYNRYLLIGAKISRLRVTSRHNEDIAMDVSLLARNFRPTVAPDTSG